MAAITRRALLSRTLLVAAVGGGALAGLTRSVSHKVAAPPPAPPAALTSALGRQQALLDGYDRAVAAGGGQAGLLRGLQADVEQHGAALRALLERYPGWRLANADTSAHGVGTATGSTGTGASPRATGTATGGGRSASPPVAATALGLAAASTSAASALRSSVLGWPTAEAHAAQVVPVLASISASLSTHAQVLA